MPSTRLNDSALSHNVVEAKLLDADTELRLALALHDESDEKSLHRLISAYMRLAIHQASKFRRYDMPMNDPIQQA